MEQLEAPIKCGHCGNIGICKVKASYTYDIFGEGDWRQQRMWFLFQCPACSRPILGETVIVEPENLDKQLEIFEKDPCFWSIDADSLATLQLYSQFSNTDKILYPQDDAIENQLALPYRVYQAYSAALKVQRADAGAFAIMVGRTLEEICNHEKAPGKVLADKIESLAASKRIPQVLADMATQLRLLRNLAAHPNENDYEIKEEDVPIIREFMDAFLEYLYIAPEKIKSLQDKIRGRNNEPEDDLGFLDEHPF